MNDIPVDFDFQENVSLEYLESGMRAVECEIKLYFALLAITLARIKMEEHYLDVAPTWKAYLLQERTDLTYQKALQLTRAGLMFWRYRPELEENGIQFRHHRSKMALVDPTVADHDPMFWERFKTFSVSGLKDYIKRKRGDINVYTDGD